ncbi:hypothetical protein ACJIZ3_012937 [Penstemon smallii]|uniref:BTB domain-containing protein n=1 Tax=Penstemon smallii TaxID=265156 RepID=A0ABD3UPS9_9LAMI
MRSSAAKAENNRGISAHVITLHKRLYHALSLGSLDSKGKWHCSDIEAQRTVLRSMDAFLGCITSETLYHPLIKDSVVVIFRALESILALKRQSVLSMASKMVAKMVNILPSTMLQSDHALDLIFHVAELIASQQLEVAMSSATTLNIILSKLSFRQERKILEILKETNAVGYLVNNVKKSCNSDVPIEYFQENAYVLSKILWRWPSFRFSVWNDSKFLIVEDAIHLMSENSVKIAVLQLYSTLALCGQGAEKLLEDGAALLQMMLHCMDSSNIHSVCMEAFRLARCLALTKRGCLKMISISCEPLVKAIIGAMDEWSLQSEKLDKNQVPVLLEACRLASITRWAGDHHFYFWKGGVDRLLLNLLLNDYNKIHQLQRDLSVNNLMIMVKKGLNENSQLFLRPYVWDILGGLAANCAENFNHEINQNEFQLNVLIMCACFSFIDSIGKSRQIFQNNLAHLNEGESAARAVLMMVYSPCKYIASLARSMLCRILKSSSEVYANYLLETLNMRLSGNEFGLPGDLQILVCVMSLACYCSLPKYRKLIIKLQGMKTIVAFIRWWLNNPIHIKRASMVPHLRDPFSEKRCCFLSSEEWEGDDMLLLFSLWIFAELLYHYVQRRIHPSDSEADFDEALLIEKLEEICRESRSPGSRWYAAHVLSYFGLFGFPSKLGKKIGKLLAENELSDVKLCLVNQYVVYVHEVVLMFRCPSLFPPGESLRKEKSGDAIKTVNLSAQVDQDSLLKLLDYVYSGYLRANDELIKKLKIFARHCKLEALFQMLCRKNPRWGAPIPRFDLSRALGPAGYNISNLLLESNTTELVNWKCDNCSAVVPHLHVHKVILESGCDYLRALFRSDMKESYSQTIKVPLSWESLNKLVSWFYSDQLTIHNFDCIWDNMNLEKKIQEVKPYIELCWLAEFWLIEDLHEECYKVVTSSLYSCRDMSTKIIQIAADFSQWKLAQVAADCMAPMYHNLRKSGELDALDNDVAEMVRAASVRFFQGGHPLAE